mmetsp:Transcript_39506/g.95552  ORF Transcript_39506/g.95552 Transcript_39506/m.95552 type:complete len:521 (+) Transcript_39506:81-1643(+)
MREISNRRIRVPSTLRMLRLLNAQSCERGKECFCYNLENEKSGPLVGDIIRPYGLAICPPCLHALSSCWGSDFPSSLKSGKICTHGWSRVLCYPQFEQVTGDAVGSMVFFRDIKQIEYSYSDGTKRAEVLESTIQAATAQAISPEDEERLQQFTDSHTEAKSQYLEHVEAKRKMKREQQEAIVAKRAARKLELARPVFHKLQSHFSGFQFESIVLDRDWDVDTGTCEFHYWPSEVALGPLAAAPSTVTQKKILNAATYAKNLYTQLEEYGFLGESFPRQLHQWLNTQEDIPPHEQALVRYFAEHKTSDFMVRVRPRQYYDRNKTYNAMAEGNRAKMVLSRLSAAECREAFTHEVVRAATSRNSRQKRLQLARHVWARNNTSRWNRNQLVSLNRVQEFGEKFDECKAEFSNLLRKIRRYKRHPDTKAWVEDTLASGNFSEFLTPRVSSKLLHRSVVSSNMLMSHYNSLHQSRFIRTRLILCTKATLVVLALMRPSTNGDDTIEDSSYTSLLLTFRSIESVM